MKNVWRWRSMDKEQKPLTGPSATIQNMSRPLNLRMWVKWNDCAGVKWCPELGAEAASVNSPPVYPTPCLFSEPAGLVAVRGDGKKELPGSLRFSQLAHEEDKQDIKGKGESCRDLHLLVHWVHLGLRGCRAGQVTISVLKAQLKTEDGAPLFQATVPPAESGSCFLSSEREDEAVIQPAWALQIMPSAQGESWTGHVWWLPAPKTYKDDKSRN